MTSVKTNYEISRQMQIDLIEAYKRVSPHCWHQHEAYERMVKEPAPRFYVKPKHAATHISRMVMGDFSVVNSLSARKRDLYHALYKVVARLSEKREFIGKSLTYIMQFAVLEPAPEFFISPERARHLREFIKHGIIKEDGSIDDTKLPSFARTREKKRKHFRETGSWT